MNERISTADVQHNCDECVERGLPGATTQTQYRQTAHHTMYYHQRNIHNLNISMACHAKCKYVDQSKERKS